MGLQANKVIRDRSLFASYLQNNQKERRREKENWGIYDGTDYKQWNAQAIRQAVQEGRALSSFNYSKKAIDTTTGSIISDPFEVNFTNEIGDDPTQSIIFNEKFLEDKDVGNWMQEIWDLIRAGHIYRGYVQMFKDRTNDARGMVGVRYFSPDRVVQDPNRHGNHINDNENLFIHTWMSATKISNKYSLKHQEILDAMQTRERYLAEIESKEERDKVFDTSPEFFDKTNGQYLVLDRYYLKKVKSYQIFDMEFGSILATKEDETEAKLIATVYKNQGRSVKIIPRAFLRQMVRTTIPALSKTLVVQEGPTELQLGRYSLFEFSSDAINGRPITWMDQLKDPQISLNKRINTATHILQTQANNALLIESDATEDPDDLDKIGRGRNKPGAYFTVIPGAIGQNKIKHLDKGNTSSEFLNAGNVILDMLRELSPAVPAIQSLGKDESGVLFQSKVAQAQISMERTNKRLSVFWHEFGGAYIKAFKQIYTYPMTLKMSDNQVIFLNVPGGIDVSTMSRMKVTVTQSPTSETYRRQLLQSYLAISQYLHDPYTRSELSRVVIGRLPGVPEEDNKRLTDAATLSSEAQKLTLMAQMQQTETALSQGQAAPSPGQTPTPQNRINPEEVLNATPQQSSG